MLLHILCSIMMMVSAIMCAPGQERENAQLIRKVESDNQSNSNRITLDPIGGGNLLRSVDSYMKRQVLRSLDDGEEREIIMLLAREDTSSNLSDTSNPNRGTLDPIGGGNLVRSLDSNTRGQVHRSLDRSHVLDSLEGGEGRENIMLLAREDKSSNQSDTSNPNRGTLDPIGGGNLVRSLDSYTGGQVLTGLDSLEGGEGRDNIMELATEDKSSNLSDISDPNRGTLDPIGGDNFVRSLDSYPGGEVHRSLGHVLDSLEGGEGRENIMRLAREDKSSSQTDTRNPNRGTLDPIGGGNILRSLDSYTGGLVHRSLNRNPVPDSLEGGEERENMMRLAREENFNTSYLSDGIVDELGGTNLLSVILQYSYMGGQGHRSLDRNHVLDSLEIGKGGENMKRMARGDKLNIHHGTSKMHTIVDPLGDGNLVRSRDSYSGEDKSNNQDDTSNSVHAVVDPLGGGNLVRSRDSYTEEDKSNNQVDTSDSVHAVVDSLGGGNMVKSRDSYTKEDKSTNQDDTGNSMHAIVDPLGGGNLVKSGDLYSTGDKVDNHRNSNPRTLDHIGGGGILRSLD